MGLGASLQQHGEAICLQGKNIFVYVELCGETPRILLSRRRRFYGQGMVPKLT